LLVLLVGFALIAGAVRLTSRLTADSQVPAELIGKWETGNPQYKGRALIFTSDAMTFQAVPGQGASSRIQRVQQRKGLDVSDYVIAGYSDAEGQTTVTLKYLVAEQLIELRNPNGVFWKRVR
jgi:hypothetical protein